MILREATEIAEKYDYEGGLKIIISVPEGVEIAKKTFNHVWELWEESPFWELPGL